MYINAQAFSFYTRIPCISAQLKKAVSVAMMEQSRQHVINKRLDSTVRCQQKLLLATVQETHQVIQDQAARITTQQGIIQVPSGVGSCGMGLLVWHASWAGSGQHGEVSAEVTARHGAGDASSDPGSSSENYNSTRNYTGT